ncbi:MAG: peptide chain release factor N(5)-glutamine methyltransferase [Candidatus Binatia bacterium]
MDAALARPTIADRLRAATEQLSAAGIDTARLDAEVLLAAVLGLDRTALYVRLRDPIDDATDERFVLAIERRARRQPVAYITGVQEFWSLPFAVTPAVLVPRPETERIVEIICARARPSTSSGRTEACGPPSSNAAVRPEPVEGPPLTICDVGTGSGCIAVALAKTLPEIRVTGLDVSADAVEIARRNAATHGVDDRLELVVSDLFAALPPERRFDVIASNPPYLAPDDPISPEVQFEPRGALWAGGDGLAVIRRLLAQAPLRLAADGWLVMEIGAGQAEAVADLARAAGLRHVSIEADLAGLPRVLVARRG